MVCWLCDILKSLSGSWQWVPFQAPGEFPSLEGMSSHKEGNQSPWVRQRMRFKKKRSQVCLEINGSNLSQLFLDARAYYLILFMNYCFVFRQLSLIYTTLPLSSATHEFELQYSFFSFKVSIFFSFFSFESWLQHLGNGSKGISSASVKSKLSEIIIKTKKFQFLSSATQEDPQTAVCPVSGPRKGPRFYPICKITSWPAYFTNAGRRHRTWLLIARLSISMSFIFP